MRIRSQTRVAQSARGLSNIWTTCVLVVSASRVLIVAAPAMLSDTTPAEFYKESRDVLMVIQGELCALSSASLCSSPTVWAADRLEMDDMDGKSFDIETQVRCRTELVASSANVQDGVVKLAVPGKGTWVINTHNVTRQIWLSSPVRCVSVVCTPGPVAEQDVCFAAGPTSTISTGTVGYGWASAISTHCTTGYSASSLRRPA